MAERELRSRIGDKLRDQFTAITNENYASPELISDLYWRLYFSNVGLPAKEQLLACRDFIGLSDEQIEIVYNTPYVPGTVWQNLFSQFGPVDLSALSVRGIPVLRSPTSTLIQYLGVAHDYRWTTFGQRMPPLSSRYPLDYLPYHSHFYFLVADHSILIEAISTKWMPCSSYFDSTVVRQGRWFSLPTEERILEATSHSIQLESYDSDYPDIDDDDDDDDDERDSDPYSSELREYADDHGEGMNFDLLSIPISPMETILIAKLEDE